MVKISRDDKRFTRLKTPRLIERNIRERYDLQEFIWNSPNEFCQELRQDMLIFGKEVLPSTVVADRIDLLAIDGDGLVILELKRGSDKFQLFQAISYAGMVAGRRRDEILSYQGVDQTRAATIDDFLETAATEEQVYQDPRIILVAEFFDYEVLAGAQWLYEKHDVNIACVRVSMAHDETNDAEYLAFTQVFPTPEIEEIAKSRRRREAIRVGVVGVAHSEQGRLTPGELLKLADDRQIRPIVDVCRRLGDIWDEKCGHSHFSYSKTTPDGWRSLCKVFISDEKMETPPGQLDVSVVTKNIAELTGQDHSVIRATLSEVYPHLVAYVKYCIVRLTTPAEAEALVSLLNKWWDLRPPHIQQTA